MSGPICLRSAFRACHPSKATQTSIRCNSITIRTYADNSKARIQGVPRTSSTQEQKKVLNNIPDNAPPKRPSPPGSIAKAPAVDTAPPTSAVEIASSTSVVSINEATKDAPKLLPSNVVAAYLTPLRHPAPHGVPVASLQLRSYSVRSLEFFSDFALRAAFYLNLPAAGPVPLPKRIERWTMPRSNFVHKKSQENFERITYKRSITIMDGDKSAVEVWLAVLRKWQFWGVGMKANVWEWEGLDVASKMDAQSKELEKDLEAKLANFGWNKTVAGSRSVEDELQKQGIKHPGTSMMYLREGSRTAKSSI